MAFEAWSFKRDSLAAGLAFLMRTAPIGRPQCAACVRGDHPGTGDKGSNPVPFSGESATNCTGIGLRWSPAAIHAPHWNAHPLKEARQGGMQPVLSTKISPRLRSTSRQSLQDGHSTRMVTTVTLPRPELQVLSRSVLEFDGVVTSRMRIRGQAARSIGLSASFWVSVSHPSTLRMVI